VTCNWCEERFERFLDGALTAGERARLLAHVDGCDACRGLLEELRVVDALLLAPRTIELPENFTVTTMADVHALPAPAKCRAPVIATLVAYVVAAWSLAGAAVLIAPDAVLHAARNVLALAGRWLAVFAGLQHSFVHLGDRGDVSSWTTVAGGIIIADGVVLVGVAIALRARPRIAGRLRW
jgi:anti-sigma factor RsiW